MSAGFGPGQLYRVQAVDGRGPWRPGLSRHWIDHESDKPLKPDVIASFGFNWRRKIPNGWTAGCACRSLPALLDWFTRTEMARLQFMGYTPIAFMPDKIIAEDEHQVIFARKFPLAVQIERLCWPADLPRDFAEVQP